MLLSFIVLYHMLSRALEDENVRDTDMLRNLLVQIMKQLEKESIKWNEEENGKTILIQVDVIDPKRLSFANKYGVEDQGKRRLKPANLLYPS